ncbi:MAG: hypothetical protein ABR543_05365 [Gemmatimonadaceae bacterium]
MKQHAGSLVLGLTLAIACSSAPRTRDAAESFGARELITSRELEAVHATDLGEAVRILRPTWLRGRGPQSIRAAVPSLPVVYVDGMRVGDAGWLRNIPTASAAEVRFISAADATTRWGNGHSSGVILVITKGLGIRD